MIEVLGHEGTSEYAAALAIKDAFLQLWPQIATTPSDDEHVKIYAGAKLANYRVADFDVVVCAKLSGRKFPVKRPLNDRDGAPVIGKPVSVPNIFIAVEVKDHDASGVHFQGGEINVKYKGHWHSATEQNRNQVFALRQYLDDQHIQLWVQRVVIMRGLDDVRGFRGALPRNFSGLDFIHAVAENTQLNKQGPAHSLSSGAQAMIELALTASIFREVSPSVLDRARMDKIASRAAKDSEWAGLLGQQMLHLRGRGGSGKTVMLLSAARAAYEDSAERTLVLTYNHALASDIRRLMVLLGVPSTADAGGITVRTVIAFMHNWFKALGVSSAGEGPEDFDTHYEALCTEALEFIKSGTASAADIEAIKLSDPQTFAFDYVFADEAQDWPAAELELIKLLYDPAQLCLADGMDQLIRGDQTNWNQGVPASSRKLVNLRRCLRMKANLAEFANAMAARAGVAWSVEPNGSAGGGRVIVVDGSFAKASDLQRQLVVEAEELGNSPIDLLYCVPPADVSVTESGRSSALARSLAAEGHAVWDGTDPAARRDFPRGKETLRVVQYASCRGLEGWTVVCETMDVFWEERRQHALVKLTGNPECPPDLESAAEQEAWRWCLMPLTRPIDTLVITLEDRNSAFAKVLLGVARQYEDVVEVRTAFKPA